MNETNFEISFNERRLFSSTRKRTYYVGGTILIGIGLFGLINAIDETSPFYWILLIGGIINLGIAFIGKYYTKEHNFITIKPEIIEFKNSTQKPKVFSINNLLDIVIESNKAEFITVYHQVSSYDFSIFSEDEKKELFEELDKIKAKLMTV